MEDLVMRAIKYARSAGRTGLGHYDAAERSEREDLWLGRVSAGLSAAVGTSIFANWVQQYPVPFGLAAIAAATLSAVQGTSKLAERAEAHRVAGAEYGRLRRRADMLQLRLGAGDVSREQGLAELDQIGEELSALAKQSRALPERLYNAAKTRFRATHPEYFEPSPRHSDKGVAGRESAAIQ